MHEGTRSLFEGTVDSSFIVARPEEHRSSAKIAEKQFAFVKELAFKTYNLWYSVLWSGQRKMMVL